MELEKEEQVKPKVDIGEKKIQQGQWKKKKTTTTEKISETKSWFFESINRIDKQKTDQEKERRHKLPISRMWGGHHYRS